MWCYSCCAHCRGMCQVGVVLHMLRRGGCSRVVVVPLPQPHEGLGAQCQQAAVAAAMGLMLWPVSTATHQPCCWPAVLCTLVDAPTLRWRCDAGSGGNRATDPAPGSSCLCADYRASAGLPGCKQQSAAPRSAPMSSEAQSSLSPPAAPSAAPGSRAAAGPHGTPPAWPAHTCCCATAPGAGSTCSSSSTGKMLVMHRHVVDAGAGHGWVI